MTREDAAGLVAYSLVIILAISFIAIGIGSLNEEIKKEIEKKE